MWEWGFEGVDVLAEDSSVNSRFGRIGVNNRGLDRRVKRNRMFGRSGVMGLDSVKNLGFGRGRVRNEGFGCSEV